MRTEVMYRPSFALVRVDLEVGESLRAESGAMVAMSPSVDLQSRMEGGILAGLGRSVLGGESMFQSTFTAVGAPGEVLLAPSLPGDIFAVSMQDQVFMVQAGSWLAGSTSLELDTRFAGLRGFMSGEGAFMVRVSGTGLLLLSSYGAIHKIILDPGESYVVDTGHIVAFEGSIRYEVQQAARGLLGSMTSGEGLVCRYTGPGEIYIQSRNLRSLALALGPLLPRQRGHS